ncbi:hypothetical protein [Rhizobium sp. NXC24]|uniref:hypothetical protein n=1 Tax=Rhizobium sp. NXC24 TaxID=2048897 RepID=UPI000CDF44B2|nr:hypothetical protein [Rhizobium sp. NXC24]AVA22484.1 hypothetical protein NXC24_CH02855 [Rhizobium sp. NXC24]
MTPDDKNWTYWLGWYAAYAILGLIFLGVIWEGQFDNVCGGSAQTWLPWARPEEHCLREWLGALSGWAGLVVGIPSILYLAKQVRMAEHATFRLAESERRRQLAACRSVLRICGRIEKNLDPANELLVPNPESKLLEQARDLRYMLEHFIELVNDPAIDLFESWFPLESGDQVDAGEIRRELSRHLRFVEENLAESEPSVTADEIVDSYKDSYNVLVSFEESMRVAAKLALKDIDQDRAGG